MKITYIHQYFNTPRMRGGTRSYEMARRLVRWGHQVNMITSSRDLNNGKKWFVTDEDGIIVHWLPVAYGNEMSYSQRVRSFFRFAVGAARRAASIDADVVFATSTPLTIALPGVYAARRRNRPMVFEVRDLWPEMPIAIGALKNPILIGAAKWLESFAYRNSEHIIALSPGMAEGITKSGFPAENVTVIPNSCDLDKFSSDELGAARFRGEHSELGNGPIVLYAGALGRVNGVDYMVRLAANCLKHDSSVRFVVLGSGSELAAVQKLAQELDVLEKNFYLYEQVPKAVIGDAFAAAAVVTSWVIDLPEAEKNSANKFFDGLAAGRPVCLNYRGWQAELLEEHEAGFVLPRDYEAAADLLVGWLRDESALRLVGASARQLGERKFSRDLLAKKLECALYSVSKS